MPRTILPADTCSTGSPWQGRFPHLWRHQRLERDGSHLYTGKNLLFHMPVSPKDLRKLEMGYRIGAAAGVIASIQSMEALRILLGLSPKLAGRLLDFQGKEIRFRTIRLEKNPDCKLCGHTKGG